MNSYPPFFQDESYTMDQVCDLPELDMPLRLSNPGEVASLVPYLLGFHPTSSVVAMAFVETRLVVTARFGLECCDHPRVLNLQLAQILEQFPDANFVLAGYADHRADADAALSMVEFLLGMDKVIDSFYVTADRYWSRTCTTPGCCPPEGRRYDASSSPTAVRAVVAGLQAVPRREDLAKRVQSPRGGAAQAARRDIDAAHAATCTLPDADLLELTEDLLDWGLAGAGALDRQELAMLSVLMDRPELRDRALLRLNRDDADSHMELWEKVVRSTPRAEQGPTLGLLGMASWVSGNGAMQQVCLQRAKQSQLEHPLLEIIETIHRITAPPSVWENLRPELLSQLSSERSGAGAQPNRGC